jgi:hypothetical protein
MNLTSSNLPNNTDTQKEAGQGEIIFPLAKIEKKTYLFRMMKPEFLMYNDDALILNTGVTVKHQKCYLS